MAEPVAAISIVPVRTASQMEEDVRRANDAKQRQPHISSLAGYVRERWEAAKDAKRDIEERMLENLRRRKGEYSGVKLAEIRAHGGSEMFLSVTSVKCRAAASWLRDTLLGVGLDRPWELSPTPLPDLPEEVLRGVHEKLTMDLVEYYQSGQPVDDAVLNRAAENLKNSAYNEVQAEARDRVERMERKMEDQLTEGGWMRAMGEVLDDITTFPSAIIKGPVPRTRKMLRWVEGGLVPVDDIRLEWERVDPFMLYPAPWASCVDDGYLIERHKLTREDLQAMIGVDGYDDDAIRTVIADFDTGGLREWLWVDTAKAEAEGKDSGSFTTLMSADLIDALQLWDSVPGKKLIEWGVPESEVADPFMSYPAEVWLIGNIVIRAVVNYDPLGRKPYYVSSYEKVPGAFWGNSVSDLIRDPQDMINAAGRSLANNMGISSGPQVGVNVSRLPPDTDITQMYPWKIWQTLATDYADNTPPISFFQPNSNAAELLKVIEYYGELADEYSGIPKYMSGSHVPGAGRTSSGLSMLINNASKALKHVVSNIDMDIINPMLERLYQHNLRYSQDPDLVGDVNIVARGAMSLVSREAAAVRRNEFLQTILTSPVAQQIVGIPGAAELLRENARLLDMNTDRIVPPRDELIAQIQAAQSQAAQQAQMQMQAGGAPTLPDGQRTGGRDSNMVSPRPNQR